MRFAIYVKIQYRINFLQSHNNCIYKGGTSKYTESLAINSQNAISIKAANNTSYSQMQSNLPSIPNGKSQHYFVKKNAITVKTLFELPHVEILLEVLKFALTKALNLDFIVIC